MHKQKEENPELAERTAQCVAKLKPILDEFNFGLGAELVYTSNGISAKPVLIPKNDAPLLAKV